MRKRYFYSHNHPHHTMPSSSTGQLYLPQGSGFQRRDGWYCHLGVMINSSQMVTEEFRNLLPLLPGQEDVTWRRRHIFLGITCDHYETLTVLFQITTSLTSHSPLLLPSFLHILVYPPRKSQIPVTFDSLLSGFIWATCNRRSTLLERRTIQIRLLYSIMWLRFLQETNSGFAVYRVFLKCLETFRSKYSMAKPGKKLHKNVSAKR